MKTSIFLLAALLLTASLFAIVPEKMSYQAVIRNTKGALVVNQTVGMRIWIRKGSDPGSIVYVEAHTPTTNTNGLAVVEIGNGTRVSGNYSTINWTEGPFFITTEIDPAGGSSYTINGSSQLLSVPFALHAKTAETITEPDPRWSGNANQTDNIGRTGSVGIGISSPVYNTQLHVYGKELGKGNVLFEGALKMSGFGSLPVEGAGTRMMWYPDKAAFRAGNVTTSGKWDFENIGAGSAAFGSNSKAEGNYSFAVNINTNAMGHGSSTFGLTTTASGDYSSAFGQNTFAPSYCETAIGYYNTDYNEYYQTQAYATDRLFVVGNGTVSKPADAFVILKNGKTGVGISSPAYRLDVAGNLNINNGVSAGTALYINGLQTIGYNNSVNFSWGDSENHNFFPGRVFIGTTYTSPGTNRLVVDGTAAKPGGSTWATWSDSRLKDVHGKYLGGLDVISKLEPVKFSYKEKNPIHLSSDIEYVGFIAQEVQEVIPEAVTEGADGFLNFDMHIVNVALVNAVKELKKENDQLKADNVQLNARFEKLEKLLLVNIQNKK